MSQPFAYAREFAIAGRMVGPGHPVFIIAEAGVAHFGSLDKAFRLVDMAAEAGADAVKFQVFKAANLISDAAPDWKRRLGSRELPYAAFREIKAYAEGRGILFFATAHDEESLEFLAELGVALTKVGSGEVDNWPFLARTAGLGVPMVFSTGMYAMDQVEAALEAVAAAQNPDVAVLHCVTRYPTPPEEVNLKAMLALRERFGLVTGYSDHTAGFHIPLAAVALGADIIEKHISLDFDVPDAQDWKVSCGPADGPHPLRDFVAQAREIQAALGSGEKRATAGEAASLAWARKSVVAAREIAAGELITPDMLAAKRPGTGIPPSEQGRVVGRMTAVAIPRDTLITWEMLS